MSLNTSPLGATTLQINIGGAGGSNGLPGTTLQNAGLSPNSSLGLGGSSRNDTINQLAVLLTGMMMMSMMGSGGLSSLLGNGSGSGLGGMGGGLGSVAGGELGSTLGGGLGTVAGGALGGPLGATVKGSLGSTLGGTAGSTLGGNTGSNLGSSLDQALGLHSPPLGDSPTSGTSPMEQLMKIFAEIMQSMFGDQDGSSSGSSTGSQPTQEEQKAYSKGVTDALTALIGGGLGQSQSLGNSSGGGNGLDGGTGLGSKGLKNLSGPADFQQLGNAVGTGVGMKAGIEALNNIGSHSDSSTRSFINKDDRAMAKEVGQFMDQYPETFGKPQYQKSAGSEAKTDTKSWAEALSKPDDDGMTPSSMDQFSKAKGMIKSAMAGDSGNTNLQARGTGGSSLGIDAMLAGDAINNMALGKLSAA